MGFPVADNTKQCVKCGTFKSIGIITSGHFLCSIECFAAFSLKVMERCDSCGEFSKSCICEITEAIQASPSARPLARPTAYLCPLCCHFNGVMSDYYGPVICIGCAHKSERLPRSGNAP